MPTDSSMSTGIIDWDRDAIRLMPTALSDGTAEWRLEDIAAAVPSYVATLILGWTDETHKDRWVDAFDQIRRWELEDAWLTMQEFHQFALAKGAERKNVWVVLCLSAPENHPTGRDSRTGGFAPWHAWAAALIRDSDDPDLRHLLIFDNCPVPYEAHVPIQQSRLNLLQKKLVDNVTRGFDFEGEGQPSPGVQIHYNQRPVSPRSNRCLSFAMHWLERMAKDDTPLDTKQTQADPRLQGFVRWMTL